MKTATKQSYAMEESEQNKHSKIMEKQELWQQSYKILEQHIQNAKDVFERLKDK